MKKIVLMIIFAGSLFHNGFSYSPPHVDSKGRYVNNYIRLDLHSRAKKVFYYNDQGKFWYTMEYTYSILLSGVGRYVVSRDSYMMIDGEKHFFKNILVNKQEDDTFTIGKITIPSSTKDIVVSNVSVYCVLVDSDNQNKLKISQRLQISMSQDHRFVIRGTRN